MDLFALIRAQARALREDAGLAESLSAMEVVRGAVKHLGLEVRPHAPDYRELEGAYGLLDRDFRQILVRDDLADDMLAEVIAHEIGHYLVHQGVERGYYLRSQSNGDPNQRIETYGIKERREAQANSFGRELVLPRSVARRLFEAGHNATRISTELKVRYETTLQQLADGVLLPELQPEPARAAAVPQPCNGSQQRAVDHRGTAFLVRAGPGTGKTKTLAARIVSLLKDGVPAEKILALTFSNKAALELSERVQNEVGTSAVNIWTGTFHAFGLDTLRKHHKLFGLRDDPKIIDASESVAMLEEALPALDLRHYLNLYEPALALRDILRAISRAKDELWGPDRYLRAAEEMLRAAVTDEDVDAAEKAREVAVVYQHYQHQLSKEGALDYGDLIMRPTLMMREDRDFRDLMRSRFTQVHVDEYQDVNRASAMLVREIAGDGSNLWVVGDARQSIYRFRGASAANVARFRRDYATGEEDGLEENYRSTHEIVEAYSTFGGTMSVSRFAGSARLRAARGSGGEPPAVFACSDPAAEMDVLAGSIRELQAAGVPLRCQTILARSNGSLARFAEELEARGVPVLYLGPLFDRAEVKDLLSLLSLVVDRAGTGLVRVAGFPEYRVPLEDVLAVFAKARTTETRVVDLLSQVASIPELSQQGRDGLLLLGRDLKGTDRGTTPWLALSRYLFDASGYVRTMLVGSSPSDNLRRVAVRQLLDALRVMPLHGSGTPIRRALDRVRHLILLADERDLRHLPPELEDLGGVRLMTIHASKGLEFDAVHLPGLYAGAVPAPNRSPACPPPAGMLGEEDENAHEAEEECIFFVAMSRAKSYLRLYRPRSRGAKNSNPSGFLSRVPASAGHSIPGVVRTRPPAAFPPILLPPPPAELTARDIEGYTDCPRRFFYERVLELSGLARGGAYLDAHGCVQRVLAYVRSLDPGVEYDRAQAAALFEEAWAATELEEHPFGQAYRRLTHAMLDRLHGSAAGAAMRAGQLSTMVGGEVISLSADRILRRGDEDVVRTIRSGRKRSGDSDKLSATMLLKAVEETFGSAARVENHYLLTGEELAINQTERKFNARMADCATAITSIRSGSYQPVASDFRCPRCAFLFICAAPC
ncbi:ATP-dependent helicase [Mesorhizobium silamurunense]|uniref:ATP-dependent helicase n=1 Tax=Mesorhizobium silamurunense TaxID=499528 RepID=UPI001784E817|nr:ATP-dependent helicase [Mesorhizobium silamurunense]